MAGTRGRWLFRIIVLGLAITFYTQLMLHHALFSSTFKSKNIPIEGCIAQHKAPADNGLSACLLVMDDNHYLIEWIAYHYHTAGLRNLIISSDPDSLTSPEKILKRWRGRMSIQLWDDSRFLPENFMNHTAHQAQRGGKSKDIDLFRHRARQAEFNLECLKEFKRQDRGWVLMVDTDEFMTISPDYAEKLDSTWPADQPGSLVTLLENLIVPSPVHESLETACFPVHRVQFAAIESAEDQVNSLVPAGYDGHDFLTLRWRRYGMHPDSYFQTKFMEPECGIHRQVPNKVIIDLKRLRYEDLHHPENQGNPHRPLSICPSNVYLRSNDTPLAAYHFLGTKEQWLYRVADKRGIGYRMARYQDLNSRLGSYESDTLRPWLHGFISSMRKKEAKRLLQGVGRLEELPGQIDPLSRSIPPEPPNATRYKVGDVIQANYKGDGAWAWAQVYSVLGGGFYNVFYTDCSQEIATFGSRMRYSGDVDDDFDISSVFANNTAYDDDNDDDK